MTRLPISLAAFLLLLFTFASPAALQAQTSKGNDAALENLGSISAGYVYNTYLAVGAISDGYAGEVYDAATTKELVNEQLTLIGSVDSSYIRLLDSGFLTNPEDVKFVKEIRSALGLLKAQTNALIVYIGSGAATDSDYFQACRKKSWAAISTLLGIEN